MTSYQQAIQYLQSLVNYERVPAYPYKKSLRQKRFKGFLRRIGNPEKSLRCLHVAGSKGKGSTCAFIAYILRQHGFKVGLYTSPHLSDLRERIRVLSPDSQQKGPAADFEGMIAPQAMARLVRELQPEIENNSAERLSFFEACTALALVYFKEQKVDFAVLETGLGGRLDATNAVDALVAVITPISYEHTQLLGNTLREIAAEKAGIIKGGGLVVISAPQPSQAREVVRVKCRKEGAILLEVGRRLCSLGLAFGRGNKAGLRLPLIGGHQEINASCAVAAVKALRNYGVNPQPAKIKKGLVKTRWPGRCEVLGYRPQLVLDGAQNVASALALREAIKKNFRYRRLILVFGISSDKDIRGVCRKLKPIADKVILTKSQNPRAAAPADLAGFFKGKEILFTQDLREAQTTALRQAGKQDLVLVTGSLFVVGEFRDAYLGS